MSPRAEPRRLRPRAVTRLILALTTVGIMVAGCGHATPAGTPGDALPSPPPAAFEPHLSQPELTWIDAAWHATVARDPACRGNHGRKLTSGSPSRALTATFAVLRRAATPARRLRALLYNSPFGPPPGNLPRGVTIDLNHQLYLNQIRGARSAFGASFYVIPAGNVTGQRGVPERCGPEQVATLRRHLSRVSRGRRARILAAQARYLAYLRYLALHAEGICATFVPRHARSLDLADNLGCATMADFERWGVLADASAYLGRGVGVFWTVVPDGVATVTLRFSPPNRHSLATSTVRPVNNVVIAREPWNAPYQSGFPDTIVLRSANGSVFKKIRTNPTHMITLCGYGC